MDSLAHTVERLVPQSLDDIIRLNREKAQLYLSTNEELDILRGPVVTGATKALISNWAFITMHLSECGSNFVYLVGCNQTERCSWMTSFVTGIDDRTIMTKRGSLYELVGEGNSDVDLPHICATLHHWKLGAFLGVPHFSSEVFRRSP